jgi:hypothetical protein
MVLQKGLTLLNKYQFTQECIKNCENVDKEHINLLRHTEIQWLNRGRVLNRVCKLNCELQEYFQENSRPDFAECFEGEETSLLIRHFSSHEPVEQVSSRPWRKCLVSNDKILGFKRKLNLWKNQVAKRNLEMFPLLLGLDNEDGYHQVPSLIEKHLEEFQNKLNSISPPFQHKRMTG